MKIYNLYKHVPELSIKLSCKSAIKKIFGMFFLVFPIVVFSQDVNYKTDLSLQKKDEKIKLGSKFSNQSFTYCDTDSDGFMPINLQDIKNYILGENINQFGYQEGIYLCSSAAKVHYVTNLSGVPQKNLVCTGNFPEYGMFDIALNQDEDIYVAVENKVVKIDNNTCQAQITYDFGINGIINSLSFDRNHNIYLGGFDSKVYKMQSGNYNQLISWHNFGSGMAAGDFVMYNDKMYIAWKQSDGCKLYEVTVDNNTNYISHINLGDLPDDTFGLASELGYLYGVTPSELYKINLNPLTFESILTNTDSDAWYGAAGKNEAVNFQTNVFETIQDAQNNQNPLPAVWTNTISGGQTVYVAIINAINNQTIIIPVDLVINVAPDYTIPQSITNCLNSNNPYVFDIRATELEIVGTQTNIIVTYHETQFDADNNTDPLPDVITNNDNNKQIYVRLTNSLTGCYSTFYFLLKIVENPVFHQPENLIFCNSSIYGIHIEVNLENQIPDILNGQNSENTIVTFYHSYQDAFSGSNPIQNQYYAETNEKEIFVRVEDGITGCFDIGSFIIYVFQENQNYQFSYTVDAIDWTYENNSIQINVTGVGNYEYSLDGIIYQDLPFFENLPIGEYKVYVRDKNNCGVLIKDVFLLMYPNFFTPNGDNINDYWNIKFSNNEPNMKIYIYDRYGKLIKSLSPTGIGWDGNFVNNPMPSSDYWFVVYRSNGKEYKGHFTLKR